MAQLSFGELTNAQKLEVADLVQKLEACANNRSKVGLVWLG